MSKLICIECNNKVKKCDYCGNEFSEGDNIFCVDEEKHFCSYPCYEDWLIEWFEREHSVFQSYVEEEEK